MSFTGAPIKGADYARDYIAWMKAGTRSLSARRKMAEMAINIGNYDDAAKAVWREYLDAGCPSA